jgi:hypothetical protein
MPEGLVIRLPDGRVMTDIPLLYRGRDKQGQHEWEACLPSSVTTRDLFWCKVELERLPRKTTVVVMVGDEEQ